MTVPSNWPELTLAVGLALVLAWVIADLVARVARSVLHAIIEDREVQAPCGIELLQRSEQSQARDLLQVIKRLRPAPIPARKFASEWQQALQELLQRLAVRALTCPRQQTALGRAPCEAAVDVAARSWIHTASRSHPRRRSTSKRAETIRMPYRLRNEGRTRLTGRRA